MNSTFQVMDDGKLVEVVLEGVPAHIKLPTQSVAVQAGKIKVPCYGGHEHFERVDGASGQIYRWTSRTALAE